MSFKKVNNVLFGSFNFITALLSLPIIGLGLLFASSHTTACAKIMEWPILILGGFILVFSLIGIVGSCKRVPWLLTAYLIVMSMLLVILLGFTIFVFVENRKGSAHLVPGKNFQEYSLKSFSSWQRIHVSKSRTWGKIKSCLSETKVCSKFAVKYHDEARFDSARLLPAESGCCKPPTACGFRFVNATYWVDPQEVHADHDCAAWSNNSSELCYDCDSCKAGVLANLRQDWFRTSILHLITIVFLFLLCCMGFGSLMYAKRDSIYDNKLGYP